MQYDCQPRRLVSRAACAVLLLWVSCGVEPSIDIDLLTPVSVNDEEIVGGRDSEGYPWIAYVVTEYGNQTYGLCSGTLIAPRWVVTARHCGAATYVRVGGSTPGVGTRHDVKAVHVPDELDADIQLLELEDAAVDATPLALNTDPNSEWPQLYDPKERNRSPNNVTVVGWGLTSDGHLASQLQEVDLPALNLCEVNELCMGRDGAGADEGDSGGPVLSRTETGRRVLVGVTYAKAEVTVRSCFESDRYKFVAAMRVSHYVDWMRRVGVPVDDYQ